MDEQGSFPRRMWRALEPVHVVVYVSPEPREACADLGVKGFWTSYFAMRAAPLGAASAELVTALFYNFSAAMVARAVPAVWDAAPPERFLEVRLAGIDAALRRLLGPEALASAELAEAAATAQEAARSVSTAGRALAAANARLEWPQEPHLVLWHAQTVLREHRGDGHVAALLGAGLDPVEALVLFAVDNALDADWLRERRGWPEAEWTSAAGRLVERGLLDGGGGPTAEGLALRAEVEDHTDALAAAPWNAVGAARAGRLVELVTPFVTTIVAAGGFPAVNPMALQPLTTAG
ncbi:hypothetical protein WEH80_29425 [Actinomycetes bacterium KLBMP 9759]